jgi:uncharacterized integral membrane protein
MVILVVVIGVLAIVAIFSIQNALPVTVALLFWKFSASLAIVVFISLLIGAVIMLLLVLWWARYKKSAKK